MIEPTQIKRKERIDSLLQHIINEPGIERTKLIGRFCLKFGAARRTVEDYLTILRMSDLIVEESGACFERRKYELVREERQRRAVAAELETLALARKQKSSPLESYDFEK